MSEVRLRFEPPLARIFIDRPERRNAMSAAMWAQIAGHCAVIEKRSDIDAVIVEGAGGDFCSGADIAEFDAAFVHLESGRTYLSTIERALESLNRIDRPTVAKIEGATIGGGLAIALACDVRFASEDARLAIPPAKLGLLYGVMETRLLVETVGPAAARDLLFSARSIETGEALRLGLVNRILPQADLAEAVHAQALAWAELSATSIRGAKKAVRAAFQSDYAQLRTLVENAAIGDDFREGRAAFRERRTPRFPKGE